MPRKVRRYDLEYEQYHSTPAQKKRRAKRNKARRQAVREGRVKLGDMKDIDHKDNNPVNNSKSNLRVQSRSANRSFSRNKDSSVKK